MFCGMIDALSFLPQDDVEGMRYLKTIIPQDSPESESCSCTSIVLMLVAPLYGFNIQLPCPVMFLMPLRMHHVPIKSAPYLRNVYDATRNNITHTNIISKGWNNKFFNLICHYHSSSWCVIEWFQHEEATLSTIIKQDAIGNLPQRRVGRRCPSTRMSSKLVCCSTGGPQDSASFFVMSGGVFILTISVKDSIIKCQCNAIYKLCCQCV